MPRNSQTSTFVEPEYKFQICLEQKTTLRYILSKEKPDEQDIDWLINLCRIINDRLEEIVPVPNPAALPAVPPGTMLNVKDYV